MINIISTMNVKAIPSIYQQVQQLANLTKEHILAGNIAMAKSCLQRAEDIFKIGSTEMKNAIVNGYIFSVTLFMEMHQYNIKQFLPKSLHTEYQKQIYLSGL